MVLYHKQVKMSMEKEYVITIRLNESGIRDNYVIPGKTKAHALARFFRYIEQHTELDAEEFEFLYIREREDGHI